MNKTKRMFLIVLGLTILLCAVGVLCVGLLTAPAVNHARHISEVLQPMLTAQNQTMHICISAGIGDDTHDLESDVFLISEDGAAYLAVESCAAAIYVTDNMLLLENGKAFRIGDGMQIRAVSYEDLLPQIGALYEAAEITAEETEDSVTYEITVTGGQADALLTAVFPGEALPVDGIRELKLRLTEKNGKPEQISFAGIGEPDGTPVSLTVTLSGFRILASGDYPIPEKVKQTAATVDPNQLFSLTEDLYRLVLALAPFADVESFDGILNLSVDCGPIQLDTQMNLSDLKTTSNSRIDPEKLQALPEMLGWLCVEGEITCTQNGDAYVYTLALDQESMQKLSRMILPELAGYGGDLTEGSASITLDAGKITSMNISIEGRISALLVQIPITVGAEFTFG